MNVVTGMKTRWLVGRISPFALFLLSLLFAASPAGAAGVVISQVYGGGGNTGAMYKNDFIELHNSGGMPVNLNGWSVQYSSATGSTTWIVTNLTDVTLAPGQYYLIQEAVGVGGTTNLPTPDANGFIAMSSTAGKVALVNTTTALSGACPTGAQIVDLVGFGSTASCYETATAPAPSNTTAVIRSSNGCTETNNNSTDFFADAPAPRNSASPAQVCAFPMVTTGAMGADQFELRRSGTGAASDNLELLLNGAVVDSRQLSEVSSWAIYGRGGADSLLVNYGYTGGFFTTAVIFNGEDPVTSAIPDDSLAIAGGSFTSVVHDYTQPAGETTLFGTITYTNAASGTGTITYAGVGSVDMAAEMDTDPMTSGPQEPGKSSIDTLTFSLPGNGDQAIAEDDGTSGNGIMQLRSGAAAATFAATRFPVPANFAINLGSDAGALTVGSLPDFSGNLTIDGQAGADTATFTGEINLNALSVTVGGAITNLSGAMLNVANTAALSGGSIDLGRQAGDLINFAMLTVNSSGTVAVSEDSDTLLAGSSTAGSLILTSAGVITDAAGASLIVTDDASFSGTGISLADNGIDVLGIGGNASFGASGGGAITIAPAGSVNFGSLNFTTSGTVSISQDSGMSLTGTSSSGSMALTSPGTIRVENGATLSGAGTVNGLLAIAANGTLSPGVNGSGSLTLSQSPDLAGSVAIQVNKTDTSLTNDKLIVSGNPLALWGGLTVTAGGDALVNGDTFDLFDAGGGLSGAFASVTLPTLHSGLEWNVSRLVVDGTISVQLAPSHSVSALLADGVNVYSSDDGQGIWRSSDHGMTWSGATVQPTSLRVKGLVKHPVAANTLYAATYGDGIFKSVDSGATWTVCLNSGLSTAGMNAVSLAVTPTGTLYAGTEAGIFTSANCVDWFATDLTLPATVATPPVTIVIDGSTVYTGLDGAGVYKSSNSGANWTPATSQPANLRVKAVVIKPGDPTTLFAATYGGGVFVSSNSSGNSANNGLSWAVCTDGTTANSGLGNLNVVSLTSAANGTLYAGTEAGVFVSTDGCATWTPMNTGLPN